jgi:FAD/FMN-containing dehydrogenase
VSIDLGDFKDVELVEEGIARVGTGAKWGDVFDFLAPFNLSVVGGRVSDVGVGGLVLGG